MPRLNSPDRAWLSAEVSKELAEQFKAAAAAEDRTSAQALRNMVRLKVRAHRVGEGQPPDSEKNRAAS